MKRSDFIKIIKIRSCWKIDKRKGNYMLPNGKLLSRYIEGLVESQMRIDSLAIMKNGDLCFSSGGSWNDETKDFDNYILTPDFEENEVCSYDRMQARIKSLIIEIVG